MNEEDLKKFEQLSEMLFSPKKEVRQQAENQLGGFKGVESVPKLQLLLSKTRNAYALFFISAQLSKIYTNNWNSFTKKQTLDIRNFLLNYLGQHGHNLPEFVCKEMLQFLARLSKLGWLDEAQNRELPDQIRKFFIQSNNIPLSTTGMMILDTLVNEMNSLNAKRGLTQHRKVAVSFRDSSLRTVIEIGLNAVTAVLKNPSSFNEKYVNASLSLILNTLKFDFVGIFPEESTEDVGSIQIPTNWRPMFEDPTTLEVLFSLYLNSSSNVQIKIMQILVLMASVRRSLFNGDEDRKAYLHRFMVGIEKVLQSKAGLNVQETYHEFCRLLARLKSNFQLIEFIASSNYTNWIDLVAKFTVHSFKSWQFSSASVYYLLNFWARMISSKPYLKAEATSYLENYTPEICKVFLQTRLEVAIGVAQDGTIEDPLENEQALEEQLESMPQIAHANYDLAGQYFVNFMEPLINQYQEVIRTKNFSKFQEIEGQLSWLIYLLGSVIGKKYLASGNNNSDEAEIIDANLCARVFRVVALVNDRLQITQNLSEDDSLKRIETAILYFMKSFKRVYIGDSLASHMKLYAKLKEILNLGDQLAILNVLMNKIASNLKVWAKSEQIIKETLVLFDDIATGYASAKLASKIETTEMIMKTHGMENFPFLQVASNMRHRTLFYSILCKLLFLNNTAEETFIDFMKPLELIGQQLEQVSSVEQFRSEKVQFVLIGWLRDLRGIVQSCTNKRTYVFFFEWLFPSHMALLHKAVNAYSDSPRVLTSLLRFISELAFNRNTRISFGSSSPNGILLFKEISKMLVFFGKGIVSKPVGQSTDIYAERYKLLLLAMECLTRGLSGDYCNFGVFTLYNDRSLVDVMEVVVKLALAIPLSDVLAYPKLCKAFFTFLETLVHNHMEAVVSFETPIFIKLVSSLEEGVKLEDLTLSSQICSALDQLLSFLHRQVIKKTKYADMLQSHLAQNKNLFPRILAQLFNLIIFEECGNQWSVSRAMLALIVTHAPFFDELRKQIIVSLGPERQQKMSEAFDKLMDGVEMNLEPKNRDKFTGNLITFKSELKSFL